MSVTAIAQAEKLLTLMLNRANLRITDMNRSTTIPFKKFLASSVIFAAATLMVLSSPMAVLADRFDEQIQALENEIGKFQKEAVKLQAQADTLKNKIASINAQKQAIQAQIELNQAKHDQLIVEIAETEKKIEDQKKILGDTLANLYVDAEVSSIELIASSKSIGDYMDKQEYQSAIRDKLNKSIKTIKELRLALEGQKVEVVRVLADQRSQRQLLAAQEAEQARLLAETRGKEAAYQARIQDRETKIQELFEQQRLSMLRAGGEIIAGDPNMGGYPAEYANPPLDSVVDRWGMYNRECVSYTAWKVHQKNGYMPYWGGVGNANEWPRNADNAGITRSSVPKVGSVGIIYSVYPGDPYGHAVWVEYVDGDSVVVSQYNWGNPGSYSEMRVPASFFDTYIYF